MLAGSDLASLQRKKAVPNSPAVVMQCCGDGMNRLVFQDARYKVIQVGTGYLPIEMEASLLFHFPDETEARYLIFFFFDIFPDPIC